MSASDLLWHFDIGLMGAFEVHYKGWGLPFDFVWARGGAPAPAFHDYCRDRPRSTTSVCQ